MQEDKELGDLKKENARKIITQNDLIEKVPPVPEYRFLLVMTIILMVGGPSLAFSFGPVMALIFIIVVVLFASFVIVMEKKYRIKNKLQRTEKGGKD